MHNNNVIIKQFHFPSKKAHQKDIAEVMVRDNHDLYPAFGTELTLQCNEW